ncbi:autotransporter outer membrane beta-barrel domain-containing protein [Mucilaginibacter boryungensis]|uniref:Peptidase S74 domain-containing protein n=1 Tax=Mucilaginibacter boryungensis TaxID=768480 RepID=A0ABR9XLK8_9SPHI|nr:hypothetical protein [Mucilaginibacter boryungensis]MBE9668253.1 hypothetical protein [Mucilaginibacter boryungensis]
MKKTFLTAIAVLSLIPFASKAQWSTTSPNTYFTYTGNVGIGTTTYSSLLTVGSASTRGTFNLVGSTADVAAFSISDSRTNGHQFTFYNGASGLGNLDLYDQTAGAYRFTINSLGNIGIGTITPSYKLQVNGSTAGISNTTTDWVVGSTGSIINLSTGASTGNTYSSLNALSNGGGAWSDLAIQSGGGNVGIGTTNPSLKLDINGQLLIEGNNSLNLGTTSHQITNNSGIVIQQNTAGEDISINNLQNNSLIFKTTNTERVKIDGSGKVGIGTTNPDELLSVNGTIHSKEVKVNLTGLPDYVFKPDYHLPTLSEVKTYIDKNSHLPDIPAAQEVEKNGLNLGEMNKLLLKKVEELTLYLIEQNKRIEILEKQVKNQ